MTSCAELVAILSVTVSELLRWKDCSVKMTVCAFKFAFSLVLIRCTLRNLCGFSQTQPTSKSPDSNRFGPRGSMHLPSQGCGRGVFGFRRRRSGCFLTGEPHASMSQQQPLQSQGLCSTSSTQVRRASMGLSSTVPVIS